MAGGKISPGRMSEAESLLEGQRMSLYDVVDENNKTMNKKGIINRTVIAAQLHEGQQGDESLGIYYDKYFKELYNQQNIESCTGLMLIYPNLCIFVLETCTEMVTEFVREIQKNEQSNSGNIQKAKICVISHDRLYQSFITKVLDIQAQKADEADPDETVEPIVIEMLTQLLKLGNYLAKQPKLSLKSALQTLREKVPDFLPQQDAIFQIVHTNDTSVMSIQEYLDLYSKPFSIVLDSELTWPINTRLFPYN